VVAAARNEYAIDISKLRARRASSRSTRIHEHGLHRVGDPYIDGDRGIRRYSGYDIEDLPQQGIRRSSRRVSLHLRRAPDRAERTEFSRQILLAHRSCPKT